MVFGQGQGPAVLKLLWAVGPFLV